MKDRKCKCTHLRSQHGKWIKQCSECPCSDYLSSIQPKWIETIAVIISSIGVIALLFLAASVTYFVIIIDEESREKTFDSLSLGEFIELLLYAVWLIAGLIAIYFVENMIMPWYSERKRKDWNEIK